MHVVKLLLENEACLPGFAGHCSIIAVTSSLHSFGKDANVFTFMKILIDSSNPCRALSFQELSKQVRQLIAGLKHVGVKPGDCVCVNAFNDVSPHAQYSNSILNAYTHRFLTQSSTLVLWVLVQCFPVSTLDTQCLKSPTIYN